MNERGTSFEQNAQPTRLILWSLNATCNLECSYCISGSMEGKKLSPTKIDMDRLRKFLDDAEETYLIVITGGGEPFLCANLIDACAEITKKHYLGMNTNLTSPRIKEFCSRIDPSRVKHIIASLHIDELKKRNLLDRYIENYAMCRSAGMNIIASEVAHPSRISEISILKKYFAVKGINLRFDPYIGMCNGKEYPQSYKEEELEIIGLAKTEIEKYYVRRKYCNAGFNACVVKENGGAQLCEQISKPIGSIYSKINFSRAGVYCPLRFCGCPLYSIDADIYAESIKCLPATRNSKNLLRWTGSKKEGFALSKLSGLKYVIRAKADRGLGKIGHGLRRLHPGIYKAAKRIEIFARPKKYRKKGN